MSEVENVPYLIRLSDNKEYPLLVRTMTIGRRDTCELILNDESGVSRQHATISIKDDEVFIEDLGSTNGVLINGVKISGQTKVSADDKLIFDIYEYQLKTPKAVFDEDDKIEFNTIVVDEITEEEFPLIDAEAEPEKAEPEKAALNIKNPLQPSLDQDDKQSSTVDSAQSQKNKAAWIEERNAGATLFMPAAEGAIDMGDPVAVDYKGTESALIVIEGGDIGQIVTLSANKNKWTIGSSQSQDVVLSKEGVSGSHATLIRDGKKWEVRDLLSQNGIRVNGNKTLHSFLANEDVIKFGPVKCLFVIPKGYKSVEKGSQATPKKRIPLMSIFVVLMLVAIALVAASFIGLIDINNVVTAIKGQ